MAFEYDCQQLINYLKNQLTSTFKLKLLEKLTSFIGSKLRLTPEGVSVSQTKYLDKMLPDHSLSHNRRVFPTLLLLADIFSR